MKMQKRCFGCLSEQLAQLMLDKNIPEELSADALNRFDLLLNDERYNQESPPEVSTHFYKIISELTGIEDLFSEEKIISTMFARELLPKFEELVKNSSQPFADAVKIAICGNIIDYGADKDFTMEKARTHLGKALDLPLNQSEVDKLERCMHEAESIFFVADNCGEAVFDRLLIEPFKSKITLGVRGKPILNDITRKELEISGLDKFKIVDTGDMTPGVSIRRSSQNFIDAMHDSDLIIAKGQGNFETLSEIDLPIFHLLCVKCEVISRITNTPQGYPLVLSRNI